MDELKGEQLILKEMLNSTNISEKIEALKRVIISMTIGKNVSSLFQSVIKCLEMPNLETKKLIYLYIINNSKSCPDDALMIVNQFCKDARDKRPIIRALAIRTMGYLRVAKLNEYLIDPLLDGLKDQSAYVRRTAVTCVPKVLEVSKDLIVSKNIAAMLNEIVETDINPSVVAAALISLKEISGIVGRPLLIDQKAITRIFSFCNSFSEWEQIYVFDILTEIANARSESDQDLSESSAARDRSALLDAIKERLIPKLSHCNKSLVISAAKLTVCYARKLHIEGEPLKKLLFKIVKSLTSLMNSDEETSFVVMQYLLGLDTQFKSLELLSDPSAFHCRSEDPLYIKLLKLKLIRKSTKEGNKAAVFEEISGYFKSSDLSFAVESVQSFFKIAGRFPSVDTFDKIAQKIAETARHLFDTHNSVVLDEIIAGYCEFLHRVNQKTALTKFKSSVLENTFFTGFLARICGLGKYFKTDSGKIGFFGLLSLLPLLAEVKSEGQLIKAMSLVGLGVNEFFKESEEVQLSVIAALVRLYLAEVENTDTLLTNLFERITAECHSPLVRDQAFFYWRLLTKDPEMAKATLTDDNFNNQSDTLTDLEDSKREKPRVELRHLGTFVNLLYSHSKGKTPLFLLNDTYQFRLKLKEKMQTMNTLDKKLVHEKERGGRKGRSGFEVFARLECKKNNSWLMIDIKNSGNFIHEILDIKVAQNHAGFIIDKGCLDVTLGRCIQKNEICMLELVLARDPSTATPFDNAISSLSIDITFNTNFDEYFFKVPYLLNTLLSSEKLNATEQSIEELINSRSIKATKFEVESYEENLTKFAKLFESNRIFKTAFGGYYFAAVDNAIIGSFKLEKKSDVEITVSFWPIDERYAALLQQLISHIISA